VEISGGTATLPDTPGIGFESHGPIWAVLADL
jgi:hypothetical protein